MVYAEALSMAESDLAEIRKQCITSLYLCTENVSKYLDSEKEAEFSKLKSYVQEYCTQEAEQEVAIQALDRAKRETDTSNVDTLEERFKSHLESMAERRLNVNRHPFMMEFDARLKKGLQKSSPNLDESDIAITETAEQYVDPITMKNIVDPVKNTICGHIYEKEAILDLIRINERLKCPVAGCGNKGPIFQEHLLSDEELKFRMTLNTHSTMIQERSITNLDDSQE